MDIIAQIDFRLLRPKFLAEQVVNTYILQINIQIIQSAGFVKHNAKYSMPWRTYFLLDDTEQIWPKK